MFSWITCSSLRLPVIASTGHALTQAVQPMQVSMISYDMPTGSIRRRAGGSTLSGRRHRGRDRRSETVSKALTGLLVQAVVLGLAVYVVVVEDAVKASMVGRATIVTLLVVCSFLVGEVNRMRAHMRALIQLLRGGIAAASGSERDDRAAVDVLVRALSSPDADVREKAHRNLLRITGQGFGPDAQAWAKWWQGARETFPKRRDAPPA